MSLRAARGIPILILPAILLGPAGCGGEAQHPTVTAPAYLSFRDQSPACSADHPPAARDLSFQAPEDQGLTDPVAVTLTTSCGDFVVEIDPVLAPRTANSFVFLARKGFYDGTVSHRVVPGNFIQFGDPTATGTGGPGYRLPDELPAPQTVYSRGTLAMANAGPNTGGSQFFLTLADLPLPANYSIFGRVISGMEVLDRIATVPLAANPPDVIPSLPLETVYLERIEIAGS
jgi:cyclophilin family peptidyl-prolyl cis-trans isomerase